MVNELEERECELLCWGNTESYFTVDELEGVIEKVLPEQDPDDIEDELRDRVMIVPVLDARDNEIGVRSRMAEALHLFRNLRQWFVGQKLTQSSTLVSDYRFIREPRRYPKRKISIDSLFEGQIENFSSSTKKALVQLVGKLKLSGFQVRSTERIAKSWEGHSRGQYSPSATIISAGTGSGKTMAFFLPALASLLTDVIKKPEFRVRILAIYPRNELLKDQFHEAWAQARKLDFSLSNAGARKISIGALFGETPSSANSSLKKGQEYRVYSQLKCLDQACRGQMRWSRADIGITKERLKCHICGHTVEEDEVRLTRQSMASSPPDILFTTTEMLNQRMTDPKLRHLFGVGTNHNLPLVLLDEVHTYEGSQGAQTALLIRRWLKLSKNKPHFVGLSATLRDASSFFSTLTSANLSRVVQIEPNPEEMFEEGAEYLLALLGDPVSQTALLSTTIQTMMLTRRILDNSVERKSRGMWGTKTFAFTDDLDVNNRLFSGYADAEGWRQYRGLLETNENGPLARLRNPTSTNVTPSDLRNYGQDWSVAKALGFPLNESDRARVARTSSQDAGYDYDAEVVVTTTTLEVGFNDLDVGAVIQHKAPKGVASYLQRRGRAGRTKIMRPWMIIVLSNFGRDRNAYHQYENLVDPEVKVQNLPLENLHILKMQAALAVLDWLSEYFPEGHIWNWLRNPKRNGQKISKLLAHVERILEPGSSRENLSDYIGKALQIEGVVLNRVLWEAPRSIHLEFVPTLRRILSSNWSAWSDDMQAIVPWVELPTGYWGSPVTGFIPSSSFVDLDVPDLQIQLQNRPKDEWPSMPYFQGLKEFSPGRISKRFSIKTGAISDWLMPADYVPDSGVSILDFEIADAFGSQKNLVAAVSLDEARTELEIYQPLVVQTTGLFADRLIGDTSNSFLRWDSLFIPPNNGLDCAIPVVSDWSGTLQNVVFYSHSGMSPLELVRFNHGADANIRLRDGQSLNLQVNWTDNGKAVGIGVRQFLDATRFEFSILEDRIDEILTDKSVEKAVRTGIFQDWLRQEPVFSGNIFSADWVGECFLAAIYLEVSQSRCHVEEAIERVCAGSSVCLLDQIPDLLFQLDVKTLANSSEDDDVVKEQKLQIELKGLLQSPDVLASLKKVAANLFIPLSKNESVRLWCRKVIGKTLAAGLHQALCILCPGIDERGVLADAVVESGASDKITVWLSEMESGGTGEIHQLHDVYSRDALNFIGVFSRCLRPGDYEQLDCDLHDVLDMSLKDDGLANALDRIRTAHGYREKLSAEKKLREKLVEKGFILSHAFLSVLHSRILRAGAGKATDSSMLNYLNKWREIEGISGIEIPLEIISTVLACEEVSFKDPETAFDRARSIEAMLWVRGAAVRQASLNHYNQFSIRNERTERLLCAALCKDLIPKVQYDLENWLEELHLILDRIGQVKLVLTREQSIELPKVVATINVNALDTHGLLLFPRIGAITRSGREILIQIELPEVLH